MAFRYRHFDKKQTIARRQATPLVNIPVQKLLLDNASRSVAWSVSIRFNGSMRHAVTAAFHMFQVKHLCHDATTGPRG